MNQTRTTQSPTPAGYCEQGSVLSLSKSDWDALAAEDRAKAQRTDRQRIQAQRRYDLHKSCCPRCGGAFFG